jgi:hypothetical protein
LGLRNSADIRDSFNSNIYRSKSVIMKVEIFLARATEVGKSKNGYVPSPAPVMSATDPETKGLVPTPAPSTAATTPSQTTRK